MPDEGCVLRFPTETLVRRHTSQECSVGLGTGARVLFQVFANETGPATSAMSEVRWLRPVWAQVGSKDGSFSVCFWW